MYTEVFQKLTYLNFSSFDDGRLQLFPGPIGVWAIGKSDETETFRSTLVKNDFNVQNRAKFLKDQNSKSMEYYKFESL